MEIKIKPIHNSVKSFLTMLILALISLNAQANPNLNWQTPNYILQAFNEIAFKNEYRETEGKLLKWQSPISYQFKYHDLAKNTLVENLFNEHLKHLSQITAHPIQISSARPNLIIHLTKDKHYAEVIKNTTQSKVKNLAKESHCMGQFQTNKNGVITKAHIVLPVDHTFNRGLLVACIVEESTQIMGLPNDSDWVNPSIANDASKVELLTGLDYVLLKILYHPSLQAGVNQVNSQGTIKAIIRELQLNSEIDLAPKNVRKFGLFPLIN